MSETLDDQTFYVCHRVHECPCRVTEMRSCLIGNKSNSKLKGFSNRGRRR